MRLNRRGRARVRRGCRLTCVAIGLSSKLFMPAYCASQQRGALRELLKTRRFLAAWCDAKSAQCLTRNAERCAPVPFIMARKEIEIMKTLTTWNPFRELDEVQNRLTTWFGGFPTRLFENGKGPETGRLVASGGYH